MIVPRRITILAAFTAVVVGFVLWQKSLSHQEKTINLSQFAMGTYVHITARGQNQDLIREAVAESWELMDRLDHDLDRRDSDGSLGRLNSSPPAEEISLTADLLSVLNLAFAVYDRSGGAFNPAMGPLIDLWGFDDPSPSPPAPELITDVLPHVDLQKVAFNPGRKIISRGDPDLVFDLGGIAKGYIVDQTAAFLKAKGLTDFIVNAGGDLIAVGDRGNGPWRIGIQDPDRPDALIAKLAVNDRAVVTSGDYERFFESDGIRYHHILDPATGYPANGCRSVTVVAEDCGLADALATAVFILGPEKGLSLIESIANTDTLIISAGGEIISSPGMEKYITWIAHPLKSS